MRGRLLGAIYDIFILTLLRWKLIIKDRTTVMVLVITMGLFVVMIESMTKSVENLSSLPIGIVDRDRTDQSTELIKGLKNVQSLRVVEGSEAELKKLLMDEMINALFIIDQGYEDSLKLGDVKGVITMYYKKDRQSASILSDIVAGEMIDSVCLYKTFHYYDRLDVEGEKLTFQQYEQYIKRLLGTSQDYDFVFQLSYEKQTQILQSKDEISNSLLYNQLIIGILGVLIAFTVMYLMSQTVNDKESNVEIRFKISSFRLLKRDLANLCTMLLFEGALAFLFVFLFIKQLGINDYIKWYSVYLLILLEALVLGFLLQLIAKMLNRMHLYQVVCSIAILFMGGLGFYSLVYGVNHGINGNMIKIIPNSWFIMGFTDIIIYGSKSGFLTDGHQMLMIMAVSLLFILLFVDIILDYVRRSA